LALLEPMLPLALILLAIQPLVDTFAVRFIIFELSLIAITIRIAFHTSPIPVVIDPLALV